MTFASSLPSSLVRSFSQWRSVVAKKRVDYCIRCAGSDLVHPECQRSLRRMASRAHSRLPTSLQFDSRLVRWDHICRISSDPFDFLAAFQHEKPLRNDEKDK